MFATVPTLFVAFLQTENWICYPHEPRSLEFHTTASQVAFHVYLALLLSFSILNPNSPFFSSTIFKLQPLPPFLDHLPPSHSPVSKPQPQPSPNFFLSPFSISLSDLKTQTFHLFATFLQPISPPQNQPLFFRFFIFNSIKIMSWCD